MTEALIFLIGLFLIYLALFRKPVDNRTKVKEAERVLRIRLEVERKVIGRRLLPEEQQAFWLDMVRLAAHRLPRSVYHTDQLNGGDDGKAK